MWDHEIRDLSRTAVGRFDACRIDEQVWSHEIDRLGSAIRWSNIASSIAIAALESALFGLVAQRAAVALASRMLQARAGAIAADAAVAATAARRTAAGSRAVVASAIRIQHGSQIVAGLATSLVQVTVRNLWTEQTLGDALLTIAFAIVPATLFRNASEIKLVRNGRVTTISGADTARIFAALPAPLRPKINLADALNLGSTALLPMTGSAGGEAATVSEAEARRVLLAAGEDVALLIARQLVAFATEQHAATGAAAKAEASRRDYVKMTGRIAAWTSSIEDELKYACENHAVGYSQMELWYQVIRGLVVLEQAVAQIRRDLASRPQEGVMIGGRLMDYQMRAD